MPVERCEVHVGEGKQRRRVIAWAHHNTTIETHATSEATSALVAMQGDGDDARHFPLDAAIVVSLGRDDALHPVFAGTIAQHTMTIGKSKSAHTTFGVRCTGPGSDAAKMGVAELDISCGSILAVPNISGASILEASVALDRETIWSRPARR